MAETKSSGFTAEEKAAMRQLAKERKASASREEGVRAVQEAIAKMSDEDRALAERVHAIITEAAPELNPKTYYGMPAYARDGKVIVFFKNAGKFTERYATLGFESVAALDEGTMWPTSWAVTALTTADEKRIAELVRRALG
ncbi:MAG: DUF1801 domain-containing protein [Micrococcales bacterium]|nr:DUF1801 domain-containing protein [Micrococcales bacterium]